MPESNFEILFIIQEAHSTVLNRHGGVFYIVRY